MARYMYLVQIMYADEGDDMFIVSEPKKAYDIIKGCIDEMTEEDEISKALKQDAYNDLNISYAESPENLFVDEVAIVYKIPFKD